MGSSTTRWKPYVCLRCHRVFEAKDMELLPGIHCPYCGYRIIAKTRPPIVKRVKAV